MRSSILLLGAIALTLSPAQAGQSARSIPKAFHGYWEYNASCEDTSDGMTVSAREIRNFESVSKVKHVEIISPRIVKLKVRTTHNGGTYGNSYSLELDESGKQLLLNSGIEGDIYHRCKP
jgi:hypothetical protein